MELYVKGLPQSVDNRGLKELFAAYAPARAKVVTDWETGASKEFGYVTIDDESQARKAIAEMHGKSVAGKQLTVNEARPRDAGARPAQANRNQNRGNRNRGNIQAGQRANQAQAAQPHRHLGHVNDFTSPYTFIRRPAFDPLPPERCHERLNDDCYDIAFEVTWTALTPVAANPCSDLSQGTTCPANDENHYQGYDNRWLMVDNRLAISPFTVKSAIANGFAAILGSCYRVENKVVPHDPDPEQFQCTGVWRRYRVAMDNSFPGLLVSIDRGKGDIQVQPVTEYFYDSPTPPAGITFTAGKPYFITYRPGYKRIIDKISDKKFAGYTEEVQYYGRYRFGMDLSFRPGEFNKRHWERFYQKNGPIITGTVNPLNLKLCKEQKQKVYMGVFKKFKQTAHHDKRTGYDGEPWHQDLTSTSPHFSPDKQVWVYYQLFKDEKGQNKIASIGLNYQYKTAFHLHDDAVPSEQHECKDMRQLCPRCALFGMTDDTKRKDNEEDKEAIGFRGRFKSATLVGPRIEEGKPVTEAFDGKIPPAVSLRRWTINGKDEIAGQFLLEILGQPKPNKRDIQGDIKDSYFDLETGMIRGAKKYLHAELTYDGFKQRIKKVDLCGTLKDYHGDAIDDRKEQKVGELEYTHTQRNYAMVCADGLSFTGTPGAENCSVEEIAALLLLLEHGLGGHGFKIGLGKSLGLGSMTSTITRIWVRDRASFKNQGGKATTWKCIDLRGNQQGAKDTRLLSALEPSIPGIGQAVHTLKTVRHAIDRLNRTEGREGRKLKFPPPANYWKKFSDRRAVR